MVPEPGLHRIRVHVANRSWANLESEFEGTCRDVDPVLAGQIANVDLGEYRGQLRQLLNRASHRAVRDDVKAVYWEFDLDNRWDSAAFLCQDYRPESAADDDWAAEFDPADVTKGPSNAQLASFYRGAWEGPAEIAANLYLVARTVASFGIVADEAWLTTLPLCAGFHDQTEVFRIRAAA
ncbi:MAG TPA: hypothetical protein VGQ58_07960 [Candidatus Limnocylindrales bacterium]|jgi:hypothetical protein|nr:hypothetical protein [Candidatus Limnocylindrales bacterium]